MGIVQGTLLFRNETHNRRLVDILACQIANTRTLPGGPQYFYVTRDMRENFYYLLTKIEENSHEGRYYLDKCEAVEIEDQSDSNEDEEEPSFVPTIWTAEP